MAQQRRSYEFLGGTVSRCRVVLATLVGLYSLWAASAAFAGPPKLPKEAPPLAPISQADAPDQFEAGTGSKTSSSTASGAQVNTLAFGGEFRCTDPWEYVAAKMDSFITGNCKGGTGGWEMWRTTRSYDSVHGEYWDGGFVTGSYNGCGWIRQQDSTSSGSTDHTGCTNPDREYCDYIYCANGTPWVWANSSGTDGVPVNVKANTVCYEFANFRPWAPGQDPAPSYLNRYVQPNEFANGTYRLVIRYVAKYPASNGSYMIMARDGAVGAGQGNWVFIPWGCVF